MGSRGLETLLRLRLRSARSAAEQGVNEMVTWSSSLRNWLSSRRYKREGLVEMRILPFSQIEQLQVGFLRVKLDSIVEGI